jgi:ABC-type nickel/cobalt efflux system permease component RcnA
MTDGTAAHGLKRGRRRVVAVTLAFMLALAMPAIALAHPLGNFTINHYAGLRVSRQVVAIDYVLDMAEIPAFQEIAAFDRNANGRPDPGEAAAYHPTQCESIRTRLDLRAGGQPAAMALQSSAIEFPPGAGGLPTLRLTCAFRAPLGLSGEPVRLEFRDNSYADRLGWREIVVTGDGVALQGDFAMLSVSNRLTAYPDDMLSSPLDQREVAFTATPAVAPSQSSGRLADQPSSPLPNPSASRDDAFTRLIALPTVDLLTLLFAPIVSFAWGAMHALSPGHGKAMVAAYLVGARGTTRHALVLGLTVTLTHTVGVFGLGLTTLIASRYVLPEQLYPWLSLASGVLVLGIGLALMITRYRAARSGRRLIPIVVTGEAHAHHHHDHDHAHGHDHGDRDHDHAHDHHHGHAHDLAGADGRITMRSLLALGISGGLIPCPTALVVLLSAIALGRVGFGLLLIVAFSAGLAVVLVAIGLLLVHGRRLLDRLPVESQALRLAPLAGAFLVILTGVVMTAQAIASVGRLSA